MVLGGGLGAVGSIGEHSNGAQSSSWHAVAAKSMVLRGRGCPQDCAKHDFGKQLSEINGFRGGLGARGSIWKHSNGAQS